MTNTPPHFNRMLGGLLLAVALVGLSACGTAKTATEAPPTTEAGAPAAAATTATTTTAPALTVEVVLAKLAPAGASNPTVNTAEDDPNNQLGRPGQYIARATFALPGAASTDTRSTDRGGSIEIWPTAELALKRADYLRGLLDAGGSVLGTEYHYLAGPVLVRVTGKVTPVNAKKIEDAVGTLPK